MFTKESIKFFSLISLISILMYKIIDAPHELVYYVNNIISFLSPFLFAFLFTILINPIVTFCEDKFKINRLVCILLAYISLSISFIVIFKSIIPFIMYSIDKSIASIPDYLDTFNELYTTYLPTDKTFALLSPHINNFLTLLLNKVLDLFSSYSSNLLFYIFNITNIILDIIMGIILSIYILYEKETLVLSFKNLLSVIFNHNLANNIIDFVSTFYEIFYSFIVGQFLDSLIIGFISFLGFEFIFNINNSIFFAFIIFITNMIPYFGPFIGGFPPVFITFLSDPVSSLWILLFLFILQQFDGNILIPRIMKNQVGLNPLTIISSILIGESLFGFVGIFFAIPFAALFKHIFNSYIYSKKS